MNNYADVLPERPLFRNSSIKITPRFKQIPIKRGLELVDELLLMLDKHGGFIAGGFAAYMAAPDFYNSNRYSSINTEFLLPKDIDVFCETEEAFKVICEVLENEFHMCNLSYNEFVNTYTTCNNHDFFFEDIIVQVVKPRIVSNGFIGLNPLSIIDCFDFTVSRCIIVRDITSWGGYIAIVDEDFEEHFSKKLLVVKNIQSPLGLLIRAHKYLVNKTYRKLDLMSMVNVIRALKNIDPVEFEKIATMIQQKDIEKLQEAIKQDASIADTNVIGDLRDWIQYMMDDAIV